MDPLPFYSFCATSAGASAALVGLQGRVDLYNRPSAPVASGPQPSSASAIEWPILPSEY